VLTAEKGNIKPDEMEFCLWYTVRDGVGNCIKEAVTPEADSNGDGAGGIGGVPPGVF
jgi:hypothetical protein